MWPGKCQSEMKPQLEGWRCDTVLPDQETVIDGYEIMVEWWLAGENRRNSERNFIQYHFILHKSHMKSPGIEPEAPKQEASIHLSFGTATDGSLMDKFHFWNQQYCWMA
jgi:hypothetical protein